MGLMMRMDAFSDDLLEGYEEPSTPAPEPEKPKRSLMVAKGIGLKFAELMTKAYVNEKDVRIKGKVYGDFSQVGGYEHWQIICNAFLLRHLV